MEIFRFTTAFSAVKIFLDKQKKGIFTDKKSIFDTREKKRIFTITPAFRHIFSLMKKKQSHAKINQFYDNVFAQNDIGLTPHKIRRLFWTRPVQATFIPLCSLNPTE